MNHAIFFLSSDTSESTKKGFEPIRGGAGKKDLYTADIESRMNLASVHDDEEIYGEHLQIRTGNFSPTATEVRSGKNEDLAINDMGDSTLDPKDLARNGLPSACVFVAKCGTLPWCSFFEC
jgi:hypothetical protein